MSAASSRLLSLALQHDPQLAALLCREPEVFVPSHVNPQVPQPALGARVLPDMTGAMNTHMQTHQSPEIGSSSLCTLTHHQFSSETAFVHPAQLPAATDTSTLFVGSRDHTVLPNAKSEAPPVSFPKSLRAKFTHDHSGRSPNGTALATDHECCQMNASPQISSLDKVYELLSDDFFVRNRPKILQAVRVIGDEHPSDPQESSATRGSSHSANCARDTSAVSVSQAHLFAPASVPRAEVLHSVKSPRREAIPKAAQCKAALAPAVWISGVGVDRSHNRLAIQACEEGQLRQERGVDVPALLHNLHTAHLKTTETAIGSPTPRQRSRSPPASPSLPYASIHRRSSPSLGRLRFHDPAIQQPQVQGGAVDVRDEEETRDNVSASETKRLPSSPRKSQSRPLSHVHLCSPGGGELPTQQLSVSSNRKTLRFEDGSPSRTPPDRLSNAFLRVQRLRRVTHRFQSWSRPFVDQIRKLCDRIAVIRLKAVEEIRREARSRVPNAVTRNLLHHTAHAVDKRSLFVTGPLPARESKNCKVLASLEARARLDNEDGLAFVRMSQHSSSRSPARRMSSTKATGTVTDFPHGTHAVATIAHCAPSRADHEAGSARAPASASMSVWGGSGSTRAAVLSNLLEVLPCRLALFMWRFAVAARKQRETLIAEAFRTEHFALSSSVFRQWSQLTQESKAMADKADHFHVTHVLGQLSRRVCQWRRWTARRRRLLGVSLTTSATYFSRLQLRSLWLWRYRFLQTRMEQFAATYYYYQRVAPAFYRCRRWSTRELQLKSNLLVSSHKWACSATPNGSLTSLPFPLLRFAEEDVPDKVVARMLSQLVPLAYAIRETKCLMQALHAALQRTEWHHYLRDDSLGSQSNSLSVCDISADFFPKGGARELSAVDRLGASLRELASFASVGSDIASPCNALDESAVSRRAHVDTINLAAGAFLRKLLMKSWRQWRAQYVARVRRCRVDALCAQRTFARFFRRWRNVSGGLKALRALAVARGCCKAMRRRLEMWRRATVVMRDVRREAARRSPVMRLRWCFRRWQTCVHEVREVRKGVSRSFARRRLGAERVCFNVWRLALTQRRKRQHILLRAVKIAVKLRRAVQHTGTASLLCVTGSQIERIREAVRTEHPSTHRSNKGWKASASRTSDAGGGSDSDRLIGEFVSLYHLFTRWRLSTELVRHRERNNRERSRQLRGGSGTVKDGAEDAEAPSHSQLLRAFRTWLSKKRKGGPHASAKPAVATSSSASIDSRSTLPSREPPTHSRTYSVAVGATVPVCLSTPLSPLANPRTPPSGGSPSVLELHGSSPVSAPTLSSRPLPVAGIGAHSPLRFPHWDGASSATSSTYPSVSHVDEHTASEETTSPVVREFLALRSKVQKVLSATLLTLPTNLMSNSDSKQESFSHSTAAPASTESSQLLLSDLSSPTHVRTPPRPLSEYRALEPRNLALRLPMHEQMGTVVPAQTTTSQPLQPETGAYQDRPRGTVDSVTISVPGVTTAIRVHSHKPAPLSLSTNVPVVGALGSTVSAHDYSSTVSALLPSVQVLRHNAGTPPSSPQETSADAMARLVDAAARDKTGLGLTDSNACWSPPRAWHDSSSSSSSSPSQPIKSAPAAHHLGAASPTAASESFGSPPVWAAPVQRTTANAWPSLANAAGTTHSLTENSPLQGQSDAKRVLNVASPRRSSLDSLRYSQLASFCSILRMLVLRRSRTQKEHALRKWHTTVVQQKRLEEVLAYAAQLYHDRLRTDMESKPPWPAPLPIPPSPTAARAKRQHAISRDAEAVRREPAAVVPSRHHSVPKSETRATPLARKSKPPAVARGRKVAKIRRPPCTKSSGICGSSQPNSKIKR